MARSLFLANGCPLRLITVPQFGAMYSLSRQTTYNFINGGKLQSVLLGGRRLILVDSAEALLRPPPSSEDVIVALFQEYMLGAK
jgi:predicted DNA-binding transcriptional regulator AlpA